MRGGLDDALQKLARRNELRRRAAAQPAPISPPAVTDLVEAVASVVARHPHLRVALGVEGVGAPAALRVWAHDGVPHVSIEAVATAPYDGVAPAVTDPDPAPPEVPAGSPNRPAGVQFAADPTSAGWGARSGSDLKAGETAPDTAPAAAPMAAGLPTAHPGPGDPRPDSGAGD
ncbi:MAG TPA: hypothetical protein VF755_17910, partial [Catenuloplanes sp.]